MMDLYVSVENLTVKDYDLLIFIKNHVPTIGQIIKKFGDKERTEERLINLGNREIQAPTQLYNAEGMKCGLSDAIPLRPAYICRKNSPCIYRENLYREKGKWALTSYGKRIIDEYLQAKKTNRKELLIKSWIPIFISAIALIKASWSDIIWIWNIIIQILQR